MGLSEKVIDWEKFQIFAAPKTKKIHKKCLKVMIFVQVCLNFEFINSIYH